MEPEHADEFDDVDSDDLEEDEFASPDGFDDPEELDDDLDDLDEDE